MHVSTAIGLGDGSLAVGALSGSCQVPCRLPQEGHPGDLQPRPAGKGGLRSGAAAPEAGVGIGESDLGAPVSSGGPRPVNLRVGLQCVSDPPSTPGLQRHRGKDAGDCLGPKSAVQS